MKLACLLIAIILLSACNTEEKEISIYFSTSFFDDGPNTWPDFGSYEELVPETIRSLKDINVTPEKFDSLERVISSSLTDNSSLGVAKNSLDGYSENIFIVVENRDSVYFNGNDDFFNAGGQYLYNNAQLASVIKSLINYNYHFKAYDAIDDVLYSKVKLKASDKF
ncbi:hypothetical protein [Sphingobacterium corticibacter]|uniref:Uncharacterized protein n=1 Tax=Sphingobacterium corticibacter TaxID=2171749 RepID=A0A2T8HGL7_9SPHI|nr:hypothetical protein [Sphingobacterium corticibacter]PVH24544.1 hypothetical protein DC487_13495 [Sphingobacterium corticibacter]